ncbi:hypothetical protein WC12_004913, partial [Escherichia coli]|nr:hypothetical protein [Escherichia coli]
FTDYFINKADSDELLQKQNLKDQWVSHADYDRMKYFGFSYKNKPHFLNYYNAALFSFFTELFDSKQYHAIIYENVSNALSYAAYQVGKTKGVKYLGLTASRFPGHALFSIMDDILAEEILAVGNRCYDEITAEDELFLNSYMDNIINIVPDYMKTNGMSKPVFLSKLLKMRNIKTVMAAIKHSLMKSSNYDIQNGKPLIRSFNAHKRNLMRLLRSKWIKQYYTNNFNGKKYIVYPLHYHPESSTSILAHYHDEFNLIKNIAFSLPTGYSLLVKDHMSAYGFNSLAFYREISSLPGVYIISPEKNAKELVIDSIGVITLTSTVGYEAAILDKPVVVFGDVFYEKHKRVLKLSNYDQISNAIDYIINSSSESKNTDASLDNKQFLYGYYKKCFPFDMNYTSNKEKREEDARYISIMIDKELRSE